MCIRLKLSEINYYQNALTTTYFVLYTSWLHVSTRLDLVCVCPGFITLSQICGGLLFVCFGFFLILDAHRQAKRAQPAICVRKEKFGVVAHSFDGFFWVSYSDQLCPVYTEPAVPCKYGFPINALTRASMYHGCGIFPLKLWTW